MFLLCVLFKNINMRVECDQCQNFIYPKHIDDNNMFSEILEKAKCKLGKRVLFQNPKTVNYFNTGGYFRYCRSFKKNKKQ
jgi:hypothetical protein